MGGSSSWSYGAGSFHWEPGSSMGESYMIAAAQARGQWQRSNAAIRNKTDEDSTRSSKFVHSPATCITVPSRSSADVHHLGRNSLYWSDSSGSWGSVDPRCFQAETKSDSQWQQSSLGTTPCEDNRADVTVLFEGDLTTRFSQYQPAGLQSLAAECNTSISAKNCTGGTGSNTLRSVTSPDIEVEWHLAEYPERKGKSSPSMCTTNVHETFNSDEDEKGSKSYDHTDMDKIQQMDTCEIGRTEIMTKPDKIQHLDSCQIGRREIMTKPDKIQRLDTCEVSRKEIMTKSDEQVDANKCQSTQQLDICEIASREIMTKRDEKVAPNKYQFGAGSHEHASFRREKGLSSRSPMQNKSLGRKTSDQNSADASVARKFGETLKYCDSLSPKPKLASRASAARSPSITEEQGPSNPSATVLGSKELTSVESFDYLPSSQVVDEPLAAPVCSQRTSHLIGTRLPAVSTIGRGYQSLSVDSSLGEGAVLSSTVDRDSGLLGQALCHSQTRAREAEKKVQKICKENGQLVDLFFREASISLTYRQLVISLQHENMWLKMSARHKPIALLQRTIFSPFHTLEWFCGKRWKNFGKGCCYLPHQMEHQHCALCHEKEGIVFVMDSNDLMIGFSLAVALGFSLAGAGLMMGWILRGY